MCPQPQLVLSRPYILLPDPLPQWTALVAQRVKHLPTKRKTWIQSLGQEDLLEKEMATHSSILAWKIPWLENPMVGESHGRKSHGRL